MSLICFFSRPAGGTFTVELATNRGKTSLSFGGKYMSDWPDGNTYPENYVRSIPFFNSIFIFV